MVVFRSFFFFFFCLDWLNTDHLHVVIFYYYDQDQHLNHQSTQYKGLHLENSYLLLKFVIIALSFFFPERPGFELLVFCESASFPCVCKDFLQFPPQVQRHAS